MLTEEDEMLDCAVASRCVETEKNHKEDR